MLDLMGFKDEYAEYLAHWHVEEESEDSDPNYEWAIPPPRKQPRVAHPPDALRTKHVLHLPEIYIPATKNRCRFSGWDLMVQENVMQHARYTCVC